MKDKDEYVILNFGVMGPYLSGKTCFVKKMVRGDDFNEKTGLTTGILFDFLDFDDEKIRIKFIEGSGLERYSLFLRDYYTRFIAVIFIYNVNETIKSFDYFLKRMDEIQKANLNENKNEPKYFMIGAKADLERKVNLQDVNDFCEKNNITYFGEISSITNTSEKLKNLVKEMISQLDERELNNVRKKYKKNILKIKELKEIQTNSNTSEKNNIQNYDLNNKLSSEEKEEEQSSNISLGKEGKKKKNYCYK